MSEFDYSWSALVKPGNSDSYFDPNLREPFQTYAADYSPVNAWWLSELSRLVYRQDKGERQQILSEVGLCEAEVFSKGCNFCSLIVSDKDMSEPFAVLVFRGTSGFEGWFSNLNALQSPWSEGGMVHTGFRNDFSKLWEDIGSALSERNLPVFYTGHSLGGAFATLAASKRKPDAVYTFGSPRVGDAVFAESVKDIPIYRIVNNRDIVATVPPSVIPFDFCHTGELRLLVSGNEQNKQSRIPVFLADHAPINYTAGIEASYLIASGYSLAESE